MEFSEWRERGVENGYRIMIIMFDMEDREYYPVYFDSREDADCYSSNIISESKCRVDKVIQL